VLELNKEVHERGNYETNEDYRVNENHYFVDLQEVADFVQELGYELTSIRWRSELDAP
jgi:hypothetical protein